MNIIETILLLALQAYFWVIIGQVALSWLIIFDVINTKNPQAANLVSLLAKLTDPVYKPLRKYIPPLGGMDITPIIVTFGIWILMDIVATIF